MTRPLLALFFSFMTFVPGIIQEYKNQVKTTQTIRKISQAAGYPQGFTPVPPDVLGDTNGRQQDCGIMLPSSGGQWVWMLYLGIGAVLVLAAHDVYLLVKYRRLKKPVHR